MTLRPGERLRLELSRLDGRGYRAYGDIKGSYRFSRYTLELAHVQSDPFAAPSRVAIRLDHSQGGCPEPYRDSPLRRLALADFLHRRVWQAIPSVQRRRGSGKSGALLLSRPSPAILARAGLQATADGVELRLGVGLPARGRRIAAAEAVQLLLEDIPKLVQTLIYQPQWRLQAHIEAVENAEALRQQLQPLGLVAFIADGSVLPRRSGVDWRPLETAVPFQAPPSLAVTLERPHGEPVRGLGIPQGVTLLVGGGYHGKSTLLRAVALGIYNHIPGDGRELVVTDDQAVKVRAEDGRSVAGVDISPLIGALPNRRSTTCFSTANASGSTSQAASMVEALEAGATALLLDEDTTASNLMIRDRTMQALIAPEQEPITPFVQTIRSLYADRGVSTVLVMGSSGDYFAVADCVIALDGYRPRDVTSQAQALARQLPAQPERSFEPTLGRQVLLPDQRPGPKPVKVAATDLVTLRLGSEVVDLRACEQLVEPDQAHAIARAIVWLQHRGPHLLAELLGAVEQHCDRSLDSLTPYPMASLSSFRRHELAAVINRLRGLSVPHSASSKKPEPPGDSGKES